MPAAARSTQFPLQRISADKRESRGGEKIKMNNKTTKTGQLLGNTFGFLACPGDRTRTTTTATTTTTYLEQSAQSCCDRQLWAGNIQRGTDQTVTTKPFARNRFQLEIVPVVADWL